MRGAVHRGAPLWCFWPNKSSTHLPAARTVRTQMSHGTRCATKSIQFVCACACVSVSVFVRAKYVLRVCVRTKVYSMYLCECTIVRVGVVIPCVLDAQPTARTYALRNSCMVQQEGEKVYQGWCATSSTLVSSKVT